MQRARVLRPRGRLERPVRIGSTVASATIANRRVVATVYDGTVPPPRGAIRAVLWVDDVDAGPLGVYYAQDLIGHLTTLLVEPRDDPPENTAQIGSAFHVYYRPQARLVAGSVVTD